ncbi:MAG: proton-conducting transporter membrane subunit, partial [Gammaproteobacteria bacterium]|nr:proton-conducting transporter membrane subunit [Gammaproteobacteria bacterium]
PAVMALLAVLGVITVVYGFLAGLTQTDVKSSLIFSVVTQVGLMFLACGLGAFTFAAWHMAVHAVWRAYQFLSAPSYLEFAEQPARTAPAWLTRRITFYTASLERLWLEPMTDWLTIRPTRALARDARDLDDRVISRLVGHPEEAGAAIPVRDRQDDFILGRGVAGGLLGWLAERLNRLEQRLLLQEGGALTARLRELGKVLATVETLLERPRYLLLMIALTFVVIL